MSRLTALKLVQWAGTGLAVCLTLFFVSRLLASDFAAARSALTAGMAGVVILLALVYAGLGAGLAFAWRRLLVAFGEAGDGQMRLHAVTQVMKYLPGNIFHLAGRHGLARRKALPHQALLLAALMETALLVTAAAMIGLLAVAHLPLPGPLALILLAGGLVAAALCLAGLAAWQWARLAPVLVRLWQARLPLTGVLAVYLGFFAVYGLIGWALLAALAPEAAGGLGLLTMGGFALAWLAGFLTPGAPAGIGVRESLLLLILSPLAGAAPVIMVAVLGRIVTVLGDVVLALVASLAGAMHGRKQGSDTRGASDWEHSLGHS